MARPIVHCLQHSERVRPLTVVEWAAQRDLDLRITRVDLEPLPDPTDIERLIVLGGQMNTDEVAANPWLDAEREFLREVLELGTARIFGICLGSQLLAEVLGGSVGRAECPEIGWQQVELTEAGLASPVFGVLDPSFEAMEWHGDSWTLPPGATLTATSPGCGTQAFSYGELVHAVQFHPEFTFERTTELAATTTDDLTRGGAVQPAHVFLADPARFETNAANCCRLLDAALLVPVVAA